MTDLAKISLDYYLLSVKKRWYTLVNPLYDLETYLVLAKSVWREANQRSVVANQFKPDYLLPKNPNKKSKNLKKQRSSNGN